MNSYQGTYQSAIILPRPLQRPLEGAVRDFLYAGSGSETDFAHPCGEPALTAPDSVTWRVFKNPLAPLRDPGRAGPAARKT
jgi:uncharacterized protein (DUF2236 family)